MLDISTREYPGLHVDALPPDDWRVKITSGSDLIWTIRGVPDAIPTP